jgi:twinkle protein
MADISEVSRLLRDRALSVCEHLLPQGKREGHEWKVGSLAGEAGQSLGVHLTGDKAGVWRDHANPEDKGDLLDLWSGVRFVPLATALDEARAWLGLERPQITRPMERSWIRPPKPQCQKPQARVLDYLREDRNLPDEVIARYRVGEYGDEIVFPFLLPDGELAMAKVRKAEPGAKPRPTAANCEPVLFGWQAMPQDAREVVITEGEIDALAMAAYGWPAMSVPYGGGGGEKQRWIESEYDRMDRFATIYLALDMDEPGEQAALEIARRLGRHRCRRVKLPRKDACQCLEDGISAEDMAAAIHSAETYDPEGLRLPSSYAGNVVALFWPNPGDHIGYRTPYDKLGDRLLFRPAEVTLWSGDSGSGKSQILSDCTSDWINQGSRVCLSSLEMKPAQTLKRMVKQAVGSDRPPEKAIHAALHWLDAGLILYELTGKAKLDQLLEVFDYARAKYGCDQFLIDSLMRLGIAGDDYNTQEQAMYRLVDWAIANSVHVHLVAHSRKGDRDRGAPDTADIKGAMEIGANAFNILTVWRDRKGEDQIAKAETEAEKRQLMEKPGVVLNVAKQRNGDFEGKIGLWFDKECYQYRSSLDNRLYRRSYVRVGGDLLDREQPARTA